VTTPEIDVCAGPEIEDAVLIAESVRQPDRFAVIFDRYFAQVHRYVEPSPIRPSRATRPSSAVYSSGKPEDQAAWSSQSIRARFRWGQSSTWCSPGLAAIRSPCPRRPACRRLCQAPPPRAERRCRTPSPSGSSPALTPSAASRHLIRPPASRRTETARTFFADQRWPPRSKPGKLDGHRREEGCSS
jgi:hypothetical protein